MTNDDVLLKIAEDLFNKTGRKHDIYYQEGYGAIIVPYNYPLHPRNIVTVISEMQMQFMKMSNGRIVFK